MTVCIYEALGTALLLIALNMSGPMGSTDALAVAGSIFVAIVMFGPVSGGHFNPAVTVSVFIKEAFNNTQDTSAIENLIFGGLIILSQITGAIISVCFCHLVLSSSDTFEAYKRELHLCPPMTDNCSMFKQISNDIKNYYGS